MRYKIAEIRPDFVARARAEGVDDQGQQVKRLVAAGGEPCRDVLRRARPGENLILASYCPFERPGPYREYGPVFILGEDSGEQPNWNELPLTADAGSEPYLRDSFVLRAYSEAEEIVGAKMAGPANAESTIEELFSAGDGAFIDARFPTYGCYALRITRG